MAHLSYQHNGKGLWLCSRVSTVRLGLSSAAAVPVLDHFPF